MDGKDLREMREIGGFRVEARVGDEMVGGKAGRGERGRGSGVRDFVLSVDDRSVFEFYSDMDGAVCVDDGEH